jgi:D-3-phosphoglycerate dehydrogenase
MDSFDLVLATGTWTDALIEIDHLAGQNVVVRAARLETPDQVRRETRSAHGIIVSTNPMPKDLIDCLGPDVRIIARAGIGLDAIDLDAAATRGIAVFHTPEYATEEVATHALALVLALNRKIVAADALARRDWTAWKDLGPITPLSSQTAGVVGAGRIGRAVAELLRAFVGHVLVFDPFVADTIPGTEKSGSLDDLLQQSSIVTLHLPLSDQTRGLLGRRELALMPPDSTVVNVSRGALIDQAALVDALRNGHIAAAGLDVLEEEPPAPDAPILSAPNVVLSPHLAWYSVASERRTRTMAVDGIIDYLQGRTPRVGRLAVDPRP